MAVAALAGSPGWVPALSSIICRVRPAVQAYSGMGSLALALPNNPVRKAPGSTISTLIPSGPTSSASASEMPSRANLVAL